jgi:excisionase family DNA binding protein
MSATKELKTDPKRATPQEVAERLNTTPPTILAWFRKGIIPAVCAEGRIYRFDLAAVDAALAARVAAGKGGR